MMLGQYKEIRTASLLFLLIFLLKIPFIYHRIFPIIFFDEALYIYKARNIAEFFSYFLPPELEDIHNLYAPLYSFVISPIFLVFHSPEFSYKIVLLLNAFLTTTIIFPIYFLSADFCPKFKIWISLAAGTLASSFGYSFSVMSEALFVPLFTFSIYFYFRSMKTGRRRYHILFWASWALLPILRNVGIVLLPAYFLTLVVTWIFQERWSMHGKRTLAIDTAALAAATIPYLIWTVSLKSHGGGFQTISGYLENSLFLIFQSLPSAMRYVEIWIGQIGYLFLATYTIGIFSFYYLKPVPPEAPDSLPLRRRFALLLFTSTLFLYGASTMHMFLAWNIQYIPRYSMYGRYADPLVPLIFVLGISRYGETDVIGFARRHPFKLSMAGILSAALIGLFLWNLPEEIEGIRVLNMGVAGIDKIMMGFHYGPVVVFVLAILMLGTVFIQKHSRMIWMISLILILNAYTISRIYQRAALYDKRNKPLMMQMCATRLAPGAKIWLFKEEMDQILWWKYKYYFHTRAQSIKFFDDIDMMNDYIVWGDDMLKAYECTGPLKDRLKTLGFRKTPKKKG